MNRIQDSISRLRIKAIALDHLHDPFWIKEYVDGRFIMRYINQVYGERYPSPKGTTLQEYLNQEDAVYWEDPQVKNFRENDLEIYLSKGEEIYMEPILGRKELFKKKYLVDEVNEREYVMGMSVNLDHVL